MARLIKKNLGRKLRLYVLHPSATSLPGIRVPRPRKHPRVSRVASSAQFLPNQLSSAGEWRVAKDSTRSRGSQMNNETNNGDAEGLRKSRPAYVEPCTTPTHQHLMACNERRCSSTLARACTFASRMGDAHAGCSGARCSTATTRELVSVPTTSWYSGPLLRPAHPTELVNI